MINKSNFTNALLIGAFVSFFFACTKKEDKVEPLATALVVTTPAVIVTDSAISLDIQINKITDQKAYQSSSDKSTFVIKFDNLQLIPMETNIDNLKIDTLVNKNVYLYGEFINLSKNRLSASDTMFVWERLSVNPPLGWSVAFCIGKVCHPPNVVMGEFSLGKESISIFDFLFSALDNKGYASNFGKGELTAEYIIYRKGMKREDGAKLFVKATAK